MDFQVQCVFCHTACVHNNSPPADKVHHLSAMLPGKQAWLRDWLLIKIQQPQWEKECYSEYIPVDLFTCIVLPSFCCSLESHLPWQIDISLLDYTAGKMHRCNMLLE